MANFRVLQDLKTLLTDGTKGIQHANITGISIIPSIRTKNEIRPTTLPSGEIILKTAVRATSETMGKRRNERYIVDGTTHFDDLANDPPTDQTLNEMMDEYERVLDKNTFDLSGEYIYEIIDSMEITPYSKGYHNWRLDCRRIWRKADGT